MGVSVIRSGGFKSSSILILQLPIAPRPNPTTRLPTHSFFFFFLFFSGGGGEPVVIIGYIYQVAA